MKLAVFGVKVGALLIDFKPQIARIKRILRFAGFEFAGKIWLATAEKRHCGIGSFMQTV